MCVDRVNQLTGPGPNPTNHEPSLLQVIVDEAHSTGVLGPGGRGLVAQEGLEEHPALLCSIHTFGKALGCHGAVLAGPAVLKEYCANYCAPFIYSTAASFHRCVAGLPTCLPACLSRGPDAGGCS